MANDTIQSAFNNINSVYFTIATKWGTLTNTTDRVAWSPEDVVIEAAPGNDGNAYNTVFGSGGDVLLNATPLVNIWTVTLHFLFKSKSYAMFSYLQQKVLGDIRDGTKPGWFDFSLEDHNDPKGTYETLSSSNAMLLNIPGKQWGARSSGDTSFSFILANAKYLAPGYQDSENPTASGNLGIRQA